MGKQARILVDLYVHLSDIVLDSESVGQVCGIGGKVGMEIDGLGMISGFVVVDGSVGRSRDGQFWWEEILGNYINWVNVGIVGRVKIYCLKKIRRSVK